jgi:hypothetical protein
MFPAPVHKFFRLKPCLIFFLRYTLSHINIFWKQFDMLSWRQSSLPATLLKCLDNMRSVVFFGPFKKRKKERELVISDEQISMYLMLATTLICDSNYSVIKPLISERVGNLLVNCNTKSPGNNFVQLRLILLCFGV